VTTRDTSATIYGIYIAAPDRVIIAGTTSLQFWDGARFTTTLTTKGYSAWGTGPNDIWVGGDSGQIWRYNGSSWSGGSSGLSGAIIGLHGTSTRDVYAASEVVNGISHWDGTKFTPMSTGSAYGSTSVYATPTRVFVTTTQGEVMTGLGSSWTTAVDVDSRLYRIIGFSADQAWVGGVSGYVLSYKP
jgi:hypothetical protein